MKRALAATLFLTAGWLFPLQAQFPEDALRFATPGIGVGARSLGMGNAYTGVANDFSALYWNPAGLAQLEYGEFSLGLSHLNYGNRSTFFDNQKSYSNNSTTLNSLGLVFPVPTHRGSLVFAFGYARNSSFTTGLSFEGFNPVSSIIQTFAPDSLSYPADLSGNIAYQLYLADVDTLTGLWDSRIRNRVTQLGKVLEGGGVNHWSAAGAIDIARNVSVGATLTYATGSYSYDRSFVEQDDDGIHTVAPFDFDQLTLDEYVESDLSGFNASLGLLYRVPERFRFGLTVRTPTAYQVREEDGILARSAFDNGDIRPVDAPFESAGSREYDVLTPWVFSAGASVILKHLMISADVEYTDWTQLAFEDAGAELMALNKEIKELFRPTANWRLGAELDAADYGVRLRGGFMYSPSPFDGDPSSFDRKHVTGGLGILLSEFTMLDLAYARGWWNSFRTNYVHPASRVEEKITTNNVIVTFSYRF
ncbi:MAG: outer membrane protein transport protein [Bacteroidota bacterium]